MKGARLTVYLCGPIAGCTDNEAMDWRERIKDALPELNHLDPMRRDYRGQNTANRELAETIVENDLGDIDISDVVLAFHPQPSTGTDMEIFYAGYMKDCLVVTIIPKTAPISPWVVVSSNYIVDSEEAAIVLLRNMAKRQVSNT